ncbi:MAG: penicillin-binding protein activator [candidate division Zixibacteria bacterium]|nr:penicillin-binding protein activator [candidate division Zixibacteria bacterium]
MMARTFIAAAVALALLFPVRGAAADRINDTREVTDAYERAWRLMDASEWQAAGSAFRDIIARFPQSKNLDLFLYNAGRADYHRSAYAEAGKAFSKLVAQFPESPLKSHSEYFLANCTYALGDVNGAVGNWLDAWRDATDERLQKLIVSSLTGAMINASSVQLTREIFARLPDDRRCLLSRQLLRGIPDSKPAVRRQLNSLCGDSTGTTSVKPSKTGITATYRVAVVLPFSGGLESFSRQIMQGAILASEEIARTRGLLLQLESFDTKGDPIETGRLVRQIDTSDVLAAIGPLTSDESSVASAALGSKQLPLIIPAATDPGLTTLSKTTFQLSANIELQGIAMADYARNILNADSTAVITSAEPNLAPIVRAFTERFRILGGTVVATEYYRTRDRDFGPYFRDLKAIMLGYQPDSIYYINAKGDTLDPEGVPVHLDCLFLPGDAAQLRQVIPQLKFYAISGSLLGSDGWGDTLLYRMGDDLTRQAVFPSPFILHENSEQFVTFSAAYKQRLGLPPQRLACLGYDAVRLVADAVLSGSNNRGSLVGSLAKVGGYSGAAGPVRFGPNRENVALPLYRIQSGAAVQLETVQTIPSPK